MLYLLYLNVRVTLTCGIFAIPSPMLNIDFIIFENVSSTLFAPIIFVFILPSELPGFG
tara:strand:+ start:160 stop:333 length:174 start_codon:yes stop_codon:yes gene_type:complete